MSNMGNYGLIILTKYRYINCFNQHNTIKQRVALIIIKVMKTKTLITIIIEMLQYWTIPKWGGGGESVLVPFSQF